jgi:phosphoribosylglycinamide formyltransferase 2
VLGLPIPDIGLVAPSASAVVLADRDSEDFRIGGLEDALALGGAGSEVDVRVFGKPATRPRRRMAVALATGSDVEAARRLAAEAAAKITISYN